MSAKEIHPINERNSVFSKYRSATWSSACAIALAYFLGILSCLPLIASRSKLCDGLSGAITAKVESRGFADILLSKPDIEIVYAKKVPALSPILIELGDCLTDAEVASTDGSFERARDRFDNSFRMMESIDSTSEEALTLAEWIRTSRYLVDSPTDNRVASANLNPAILFNAPQRPLPTKWIDEATKVYQKLENAEEATKNAKNDDMIYKRIDQLSWELLYGELLLLPQAGRIRQGGQFLEHGLKELRDINRELAANANAMELTLAAAQPLLALRLDAIRLREDRLREKMETAHKLELERFEIVQRMAVEYRFMAEKLAIGQRDANLLLWDSSLLEFEEAEERGERLKSLVAEAEKKLLKEEFLLQTEPHQPEANEKILPIFDASVIEQIRIARTFAALRIAESLPEGKDRRQILESAADRALKFPDAGGPATQIAEGELFERLALDIIGNGLFDRDRETAAAPYFLEAKKRFNAANQLLQAKGVEHRFKNQIAMVGPGGLFENAGRGNIAALALAAAAPNKASTVLTNRIDERLTRLSTENEDLLKAERLVQAGDTVAGLELVFGSAQRHFSANVCYAYIRTALRHRQRQDIKTLKRELDSALNGKIFPAGDFRGPFLSGLLTLEDVRRTIGDVNPNQLFGLQSSPLRTQYRDQLTGAIKSFANSRSLLKEKKEREQELVQAYLALAGALRFALNTDSNFQPEDRISQGDLKSFAESASQYFERAPKNDLDGIEAAVAALQARGFLTWSSTTDSSLESGLAAFAAANDRVSSLPFEDAAIRQFGSLVLEAVRRRQSNPTGDLDNERTLRRTFEAISVASLSSRFSSPTEISKNLDVGLMELLSLGASTATGTNRLLTVDASELLKRAERDDPQSLNILGRTLQVMAITEGLGIQIDRNPFALRSPTEGERTLISNAIRFAVLANLDENKHVIDPKNAPQLSDVKVAVNNISSALGGFCLAKALDAQILSLGLAPHSDRDAWAALLLDTVSRTQARLTNVINTRYPGFVSEFNEIANRWRDDKEALRTAAEATSRLRLSDAKDVVTANLSRHPKSSRLWDLAFEIGARTIRIAFPVDSLGRRPVSSEREVALNDFESLLALADNYQMANSSIGLQAKSAISIHRKQPDAAIRSIEAASAVLGTSERQSREVNSTASVMRAELNRNHSIEAPPVLLKNSQ